MMITVKRLRNTIARQSLSSTATNHLLWGTVCIGLLLFAAAMWHNVQSLSRQNVSLKEEVRLLSARHASCTARGTWQAGTTKTFQTLTTDGLRSYLVHLPAHFQTTAFYPLVIHFPGKGASAALGAQQAKLDMLPAIVAYPSPTIGKDGYTAWQGAPYSSGADDVGFTVAVLDKIQSQLCIDRDRVYATGMSNGGGMVSLLSCRLSDRFAAFGIVAGAMYYPTGDCAPQNPTPLISIHGDQDPSVPYQGSITRKLPSISKWAAERARDNQCNVRPTVTNIDAVTTRTTWNGCKHNATVESIRQHGGGHFWGPDVTPLLWQFMSAHTL